MQTIPCERCGKLVTKRGGRKYCNKCRKIVDDELNRKYCEKHAKHKKRD